jgi:hypothetical protein
MATQVIEYDAIYDDTLYHLKQTVKGFFIKPNGRKYWDRITKRQFENAKKFMVKE